MVNKKGFRNIARAIDRKKIYLFFWFSCTSRRQLHYHSQRRDPKESVTRPSSNYYEYESVMRSLPYTSGGSSSSRLVDNNSNVLTRQGEFHSSPTYHHTYIQQPVRLTHTHILSSCLVSGGITPSTAAVVTTTTLNNNNNSAVRNQQQQSSHHHPVSPAKSSNYTQYNYGSGDIQDQNSVHLQPHRRPMTNNIYTSSIYQNHQQHQRQSSQGPYITQVTIRDNQHMIQSPNI